jgi:transcriptional regulator with GAF, ATPase, and Fis domain
MISPGVVAAQVVWRQCILTERAVVAPAVLESLVQAGITTYEVALDALSGPGIVFFNEPNALVLETIRMASRGGLERVLAVSLGETGVVPAAAWRLLAAGASDVIPWHRREQPAAEIAGRFQRWDEVDRVISSPLVRDNLVGRSPTWIAALRQLVEVARFTDASVLILGETGTGKELAARLIHTLDRRPRKGDLVVLDCATVVPQLAGSEFFGHERGAFTDAVAARDGCFALANGGTLFLDEIGELPLPLQAELLRAIQERTFKRVGSNVWRNSVFRLVCASNRELLAEVGQSAFRSDLYYRIASVTITLPPLRERSSDILALVQGFLTALHPEKDPPELDDAVREYLLARTYPGNIRDLRQLVFRIDARHTGPGPITVGDIPPDERPSPTDQPSDWRDGAFESAIRRAVTRGIGLREIGHAATEIAIDIAVDVEGSVQRAARQLGVTDRALQLRRAARRERTGVVTAADPSEWAEGPLPS